MPMYSTVEEILRDYTGRRAGLLEALIHEKVNLCLYGHPNGVWEVTTPDEMIPPVLPEPTLGINFVRDFMIRKDWLSLIAAHSDAWVLALAFHMGAGLNRDERKGLFSLINQMPTVSEVVTGRKPLGEMPAIDSGSKSCGGTKRSREHGETLCRIGERNNNEDEFWIGCYKFDRWFDGNIVKRTTGKAGRIKPVQVPISQHHEEWVVVEPADADY